jgi:hypothetical protein
LRIPTIKHCYALQELFKRAIGLPLWHDVNVACDADGNVVGTGCNARLGTAGAPHAIEQFERAFSVKTQHFKFHSPWLFVCEEPTHFIWSHPFYHQPNPFRFQTLGGIVEYQHQHDTSVNIVFQRPTDGRIDLSFVAGEMMVYIVPTSDTM